MGGRNGWSHVTRGGKGSPGVTWRDVSGGGGGGERKVRALPSGSGSRSASAIVGKPSPEQGGGAVRCLRVQRGPLSKDGRGHQRRRRRPSGGIGAG